LACARLFAPRKCGFMPRARWPRSPRGSSGSSRHR
jgi:hypothetical protein